MGKDRKVILEIDNKLIDEVFTYDSAYLYAISKFEESKSNKEANIYVSGIQVTTIKNQKNVKQASV